MIDFNDAPKVTFSTPSWLAPSPRGFDFDAIRSSYPLESIVGRDVTLKRSGKELKGLCPFHDERSASFHIIESKGFYHCFGCGAHGDVIDYITNTRGLDLVGAVQALTGGVAPSFSSADRERRKSENAKLDEEIRVSREKATLEARARWDRATAVNGHVPAYLTRKNIPSYGCRCEGDNLLVPVYDAAGEMITVQKIEPQAGGNKRFHTGAPAKAGRFEMAGDDTIVVVEGFATGASVHAATGHTVFVAFSKDWMQCVAESLRQAHPNRPMIIAADIGADVVAMKAANAVGGRVVLPDLQGADGSDFNDQAGHYGLEDVARTFGKAAKQTPLAVISPSVWQGQEPPIRTWAVDGFIPMGQATLLTGAGAAGKSLLSQVQCTSIAMGTTFMGLETRPMKALYITCEDDDPELQRRQTAICEGFGMQLSDTDGRLYLLSLCGQLGNDLCTFDDKRNLIVSPRYNQIVDTCRLLGVEFVVLDNTSHMFTGNENARNEVAGFVNLCNAMAREIGGAVVMVGFPNKAGASYSGSTAWENQVRSRLFLEIPQDPEGNPLDTDMRTLRNEKANYAKRGVAVDFMWHKGTFLLPNDAPPGAASEAITTAMDAHDEERFLDGLDRLIGRNIVLSASVRGNYAPRELVKLASCKGIGTKRLEAAMNRLFEAGEIASDVQLWKKPNRHYAIGLGRKGGHVE